MPLARWWIAAWAALSPALALAQEDAATSHGWVWAFVTIAIVIALFLVVFRRRPPVQGHGPR